MSNSTPRRWKLALTVLLLVVSSMPARAETLLDIYELALENDAQLKAQEAQYLANIENKNVALSALLPQVRAGYGITGTDAESLSRQIVGFTPSAQPIIDDGYNRTDVETEGWDFALAQPLFDLGAWYSLQAGQEFSKQAEAEFASATQNLIVRTVEAYLGVLRAQDNLAAAEAAERAVSGLRVPPAPRRAGNVAASDRAVDHLRSLGAVDVILAAMATHAENAEVRRRRPAARVGRGCSSGP